MSELSGKVAVVTGAGQGVGRGIALALAQAGSAVAVTGRTLSKCENTVKEIESRGGRAIALECDVSSREQVDNTVRQVVEAYGSIDIVVNNAQRARPMVSLIDTSDKELEYTMNTGFFGTVYFMQACFPYLKENKGSVINIGSLAATAGDPGFAAYAGAKEAIRGIGRVAAREWGQYGITVNTVCPLSDSPGQEMLKEHQPATFKAIVDRTSLKRVGSSEKEVGGTVVFLCSEAGKYITGQTINVDGGVWVAP